MMCGPEGIKGLAKSVAGVNTLTAGGEGSSGGYGTGVTPTTRVSSRLMRKNSPASFAALFGTPLQGS